MRLFYEDELIRLFQGRWQDLTPRVPSGSVNLIVTDPEYTLPDLTDYFEECSRMLHAEGSLYCFGDVNTIAARWFNQAAFRFKRLLVWHYKNSPKPRGRWRQSMQGIIYAYNSPRAYFNEDAARVPYTEGALKLNGRVRPSAGRLSVAKAYDTSRGALPRDVIEVPALTGHRARERRGHRDQKPRELIRRLILSSSVEGQTVFDGFAGSGTTLLEARALNRRAFGSELLEENCRQLTKGL